MEKKKYMKPSMKVYEMSQTPQILAGSGGDMNYIPTIPGLPVDEKHLA